MGKLSWANNAYAVLLLCAATAIALPAQTFSTLHSFDGTDGVAPFAALVEAADGNLYGTTGAGGANSAGTVFKITPSGTLTALYSFCFQSGCTDGELPHAGLVQGTNGNFYGTTEYGGANYPGTVFEITPAGTLTTLHAFCSQSGCPDGAYPEAALVQGTDGNFYGTTAWGGAHGYGTVFKITPSGTLTTLYSFCAQSGCTDGLVPYAGLVMGTDGNFYGTTHCSQSGCTGGELLHAGLVQGTDTGSTVNGTVFKITPSGTLTTLYRFSCSQGGCTDGASPIGGLVQATNENFYGTTPWGGAYGYGTVFKITPSGTLTTLYSFCSQSRCADGASPTAALVQATDGNLYGTTTGTTGNTGTIFRITPGGALTTLYSFCSQKRCADGASPSAALVQDTNGKFYGTTGGGGANGDGTVFSLSVGLGPFVEAQPTSGKVGAAVKILGTNLTGATSVTFNGTAATFTVVSSSEITTTVPAGATTGQVKVTVSGHTLLSNTKFRVAP
jgi:uncharacterized repeat protein (TIGR03803 family)